MASSWNHKMCPISSPQYFLPIYHSLTQPCKSSILVSGKFPGSPRCSVPYGLSCLWFIQKHLHISSSMGLKTKARKVRFPAVPVFSPQTFLLLRGSGSIGEWEKFHSQNTNSQTLRDRNWEKNSTSYLKNIPLPYLREVNIWLLRNRGNWLGHDYFSEVQQVLIIAICSNSLVIKQLLGFLFPST